ncbi:secretory immunoglobulin A-binding protein EsiB [Verrucomicrobiota bacterium]|nr:secretory immunoglobulin A-binding protein EsiB [Verrucomicrobiota bacterium]
MMNLAPRLLLSAILLALLALLPVSVSAGMTPAEVTAFESCKAQAENGDVGAQNTLGLCYYFGRGVAKDYVQAVNLWRHGANRGDAYAQHLLAHRYATGEGVAKDPMEAVNLWRKSANQGNAKAQFELGSCYFFGRGVEKDEVEAYAYWSIAGITFDSARMSLAMIEKEVPNYIIQLGKQRAKQLQKEIEVTNVTKSTEANILARKSPGVVVTKPAPGVTETPPTRSGDTLDDKMNSLFGRKK